MIEFMQESSGNVLGVQAGGKLTEDDYRSRLVPRLESLIERFGSVRVLFYTDETFQSWDLHSAWANTALDVRHRADFERIAVVGAPAWEAWCLKLAGLLMAGEIRTFQPDQLQQAWNWLRA
jgi:SpoIIAA-like